MSLPPSSPRLPSPPPPTEIQIGPKSPSMGSSNNLESSIEQSVIDANAKRRIHPGTRSADMAAGPPLVPLSELDSAFQLQEHLKALHHHYIKPSDSDSSVPINRETATLIATQPEGVDRALWLYELCRFLINKCNELIIGFLFDDPPCSATTCPEMRASEWQFLCAVHESPKSCCAIDYCCHTLDWATNIVTSQKIFPSRLSLGAGDAMDDRGAGVKHLTNIFRRLHRIFAHAWFQHRGVFWQVEGQTGLYVLFKTVCDTYELLPAENYKLPPEAEGLEPVEEVKAQAPTILKADGNHKSNSHAEDDFMNVSRSGTSTRRHIRQSPSVGSAVPTVLESDEEDPDVTAKFDKLNITEEEEEDSGNTTETTEVPVIVDSYEVDEHNDGSPPPPAKVESPILEHTELESEAPDDPSSSLTPDSSEDEPEEEEKDELKEPDEEDAAESMSPIVPDAEITITAPSPIEAEGRSIEKELDKEKPKGEESEEKEEKSKEKESEEKSKEPKEEEKKDSST
ncbi:Mob1/phocein [Glarea lozoyensis ATCC 20868]|uniref:Mob1/phocein n=1 Tax=Glarea lozoyensis (strain ATCC 20868 / MF5171) TaxID=1116229 RepID=S3CHZ6_GLAL2|nr:Mob1/phocein [Glarea lozoyensis ATCC 20868]EPE26102.1 Mob1/phocein [Glarea lozoyensis ATCC 20868]